MKSFLRIVPVIASLISCSAMAQEPVVESTEINFNKVFVTSDAVVQSSGDLPQDLPLANVNPSDCPSCSTGCSDCTPEHNSYWYSRVELLGLWRERWEGSGLVFNGNNSILDSNGLDGDETWGSRIAVGFRCDDCVEYELSGFIVDEFRDTKTYRSPFDLNLPVANHPFSFDDFGVNASRIDVDYETDLGGFELMARSWICSSCDPCGPRLSVECGARYLNINERFGIASQFAPVRASDGFQDYYYRARTRNYIFGPQLGVVYDSATWNGLSVQLRARGVFGINMIDTDVTLREYTNATAFDKDRDEASFAQIIDLGAHLNYKPCSNATLRAGYTILYVNGYAGAPDQFTGNLAQPGEYDDDNSVMFHGLALSIEVNW